MREQIRNWAINFIVGTILNSLSPEQIKREIDRAIDRIEELILDSDNTLDDNILPVLNMLRQALNLEVQEKE